MSRLLSRPTRMCFPHTRSFNQGAMSPSLVGVGECLHTRLLWHRPARSALWDEGRATHAALGRALASLRSSRLTLAQARPLANTIPLGILPVSSSDSSAWYSAPDAEAGARSASTVSYRLTLTHPNLVSRGLQAPAGCLAHARPAPFESSVLAVKPQ